MKLEFSQQVFGNTSNIGFNQHPASGSRVVTWTRPDGRTDKYDEADIRFFAILQTRLNRVLTVQYVRL
jgi:hypothetical protein